MREVRRKNPGSKSGTTPLPTFCATPRSRNAHWHLTRAISCENLQGKCRDPRSRKTRTGDFAQACPVEISQEQFYARIYNLLEKGRRPGRLPWSTAGLSSCRKNSFGEKHVLYTSNSKTANAKSTNEHHHLPHQPILYQPIWGSPKKSMKS